MTNVASFNQVTSRNRRSNDLSSQGIDREILNQFKSYCVKRKFRGNKFSSKGFIYKLVCISLSYRNWQLKSSSDIKGDARLPSSYKPNYSLYKLPLSNCLTNILFSEKTNNGRWTWKIATSFKILGTLRNPCKQHITALYHSPKTREVFNVTDRRQAIAL